MPIEYHYLNIQIVSNTNTASLKAHFALRGTLEGRPDVCRKSGEEVSLVGGDACRFMLEYDMNSILNGTLYIAPSSRLTLNQNRAIISFAKLGVQRFNTSNTSISTNSWGRVKS